MTPETLKAACDGLNKRTGAKARIEELEAKLQQAEARLRVMTEALERIADLPSGAIVTPDFDEPFSASVAREALTTAKKP